MLKGRHWVFVYLLIPIFMIGLAVWLRLSLDPLIGNQYPFATVLVAILCCAWYAGFRSAAAAVIIGAVAVAYFIFEPRGELTLTRNGQVSTLLYVLVGTFVAFLGGHMHSARRRAEAGLGASEAKFGSYMHNAPFGIFVVGEGRFIDCNQAAAIMLGYEGVKDVVGRPTSMLQAHFVRDSVQSAEYPQEGEYRIKDTQGRILWVMARTMPLPGGLSLTYCIDITQKKASDERLRADRDRFENIVNAVPAAICSISRRKDQTVHFEYATDKVHDIFGFTPAQLKLDGSLVYSVMHPDDRTVVRETIQESARNLTPWKAEYRVVRSGQPTKWVEAHSIPVKEPDGSIVWHGYIADVTDRKRTMAALADSESRLKLLVDGITDYAIFLLDPTGKILTWNPGAVIVKGYSANDAIGRNYSMLFTADDLAAGKPRKQLDQAATHGSVVVDGWRVRKDGNRYWSNGILAALYDDHRQVRAYTKVTRDLTAKRRNDELLLQILDHTLDGIIGIDSSGVVTMFNRAAEGIFGYRHDEVLCKSVNMLMPEDQSSVVGQLDAFGAGRELRGRRKDGRMFPLELAATEFHLFEERHFVGIVRDLSEKKLLEAKFLQAQKMEAFGQLAGGIAHDLNNLLTIVYGNIHMLHEQLAQASVETLEYVDEIRSASKRASTLTSQLLAFSRQQMLELRPVNLNDVVSDIEKMLMRIIGEDIEFTTVLHPKLSLVKVDRGQMDQAIVNLVINARDAMPTGGKITLETSDIELDSEYQKTHLDVSPGHYVMLAVTDTGVGMPPEVQERAFEPFFTTKPVGQGSGLGLSVVLGIIKQSGGNIHLYSEVGSGTSVKLFFPAVKTAQPIVEPNAPPVRGGQETVLLVEDEEGVRKLASRALMSAGYTVLSAEDGSKALRLIAKDPRRVDILVTDVVMPGIGGRALAETLVKERPWLKVLFISGYTADAVVRHGVLEADVAFLQKPFTPDGLARKVRAVLDAAHKPSAPAA